MANEIQQPTRMVKQEKPAKAWFSDVRARFNIPEDTGTPWEVDAPSRMEVEANLVTPDRKNRRFFDFLGDWASPKAARQTIEGLRQQESVTGYNFVNYDEAQKTALIARWLRENYPQTYVGQRLDDVELVNTVLNNPSSLWNSGHWGRYGGAPGTRTPNGLGPDGKPITDEARINQFMAFYSAPLEQKRAEMERFLFSPNAEGRARVALTPSGPRVPLAADLVEGIGRSLHSVSILPGSATQEVYGQLQNLSREINQLKSTYDRLPEDQKRGPAGQAIVAQLREKQLRAEHSIVAVDQLLAPEAFSAVGSAAVFGGAVKGAKVLSVLARQGKNPLVRKVAQFITAPGKAAAFARGAFAGGAEAASQEEIRGLIQNKTAEEIKQMRDSAFIVGAAAFGVLNPLGGIFRHAWMGKRVKDGVPIGGKVGTPEQLKTHKDTILGRSADDLVKNIGIDSVTPIEDQLTAHFKKEYGDDVVNSPGWSEFLAALKIKIGDYFSPEAQAARAARDRANAPIEFRNKQTGATLDIKKVALESDPKKPHETSIQELIRRYGDNPAAVRILVAEAKDRNNGRVPDEIKPFLEEMGYDADGVPKAPPPPPPGDGGAGPAGLAGAAAPSTPQLGPDGKPLEAPSPTAPAADGRYDGKSFRDFYDNGPVAPGVATPFFNPFMPVSRALSEQAEATQPVKAPAPDARWTEQDLSKFGDSFKTFHQQFLQLAEGIVDDILNGADPARGYALLLDALNIEGFPRGQKVTVMMADGKPDLITDIEYAQQVFSLAMGRKVPEVGAAQFDEIVSRLVRSAPEDVKLALDAFPNSRMGAIEAYDAWAARGGNLSRETRQTLRDGDMLANLNPQRTVDTQEAVKNLAFTESSPVSDAQRRTMIGAALSRLGSFFVNAKGQMIPFRFIVDPNKPPLDVVPHPDGTGVIVGRPNDTSTPKGLNELLKWSDEERIPVEARVILPPNHRRTPRIFRPAKIAWALLRANLDKDTIFDDVRTATPTTLKEDGSVDQATFAGGTFKLDGTRWDGKDIVMSVLSENFDPNTFSPQDVINTLARYRESIGDRQFVFGVFRFYSKELKKDVVSVDINVLVDQKNKNAAVQTATNLNQNSVWDASVGSEIATGKDGAKPLRPSAGQVRRIVADLSEGRATELTPKNIVEQYIDAGFYETGRDASNRVVLRRDPQVSSRARARAAEIIDRALNMKTTPPPSPPPVAPAPPAVPPTPPPTGGPSVSAPPAPPAKPKKPARPRKPKAEPADSGEKPKPKPKKDKPVKSSPAQQQLPLVDKTRKGRKK